jgi:hypothetical protein
MNLSTISNSDLLAELRRRNLLLGHPFSELDVDNFARDLGYLPTEEDIDRICLSINMTFDANEGINWDVIEYHISEHFRTQHEEEEE